MTPRELLDYRIDGHVAQHTGCSFLPKTRKKIHQDLVVGIWVRAGVRLPKAEDDGFWSGFVRSVDGSVVADFFRPELLLKTDEWLDLDFPVGKEKKG